MKQYDDKLEKKLTAVFGSVAILAVIVNLHIVGYAISNVLNAAKDIASLIVVIAVFIVANKIFKKDNDVDFSMLFEGYLKEWISQNDYLISEEFDGEGKGKFATRFCSMVIDHSNFVTQKKLARDASQNKEKATFVRLPIEGKSQFEFRFNERTFDKQEAYRKDDRADLGAIIDQFSKRINDKFGDIAIKAKADKSNKAIIVSFDNIEPTKANARKLIDIVEFVKTMVMALA
ncbi:MAG: hypothetical protein WC001_05930 [Desulfurivibrionaceae bacterium]